MATFLVAGCLIRHWTVSNWRESLIGRRLALALAILLGTYVEYRWFGIGLIVASWGWARTSVGGVAYLIALLLLCSLNQNVDALAALPMIGIARRAMRSPRRLRGML